MSCRCPGCRTRRATFTSLLKHVDATGHKHCSCGQNVYGFDPHRPGTAGCIHQKWDYIFNEPAQRSVLPHEPCPF